MSDGLLTCCRIMIEQLQRQHPHPVAGQHDYCDECGVDLVFADGAWFADLPGSFGRIREQYARTLDAPLAATAYQRLLMGAKAK